MDQIILKNSDYRAVIDTAHGANCIALHNEKYGLSILREVKKGQEKDNPFLYGMPLLFPANRISGGRFTFEGRLYDFGINEEKTACQLHGCLHGLPFTLLDMQKDRVLCALDVCENGLYGSFPHAFRISIEYLLDEQGLTQTVGILNRSNENMPCLLGFHTTFNAQNQEGDAYLVKAEVGECYERNEHYLPTGNLIKDDALTNALRNGTFSACGTKISRHYRASGERKMMLTDPNRRFTVLYENDEKYTYRLFFNGEANEYICLEPQNCLIDAINTACPHEGLGFDVIKAGECKIYRSKISLIENDQ